MKRYNYDISVITPLYNEEKNIEEHFIRIDKALSESGRDFEVIFINDGSTDGSEAILEALFNKHRNVAVVNLYRKNGKATALEAGIEIAKGRYIVTIDGDLQYDAHDIVLMARELDKGYDFISGRRVDRGDSKATIITSRIFNLVIKAMTGLDFVDYFSGLKCFRKNVIDYLSLYGGLYRFALVYASRERFKVKEMAIRHYHRTRGDSKYDPIKRFTMAILDIVTVLFTITFSQDRIYYIGILGLLFLGASAILLFSPVLFLLNKGSFLSRALIQTGTVLLFLGIQAMIVRKLSIDYFDRHQKGYFKRKRNVKDILANKVSGQVL